MLVIAVSKIRILVRLSQNLNQRTMWLEAVELKLELRSVIVEVGLQHQGLVTAVVLILTSSSDRSGESLEVFLIQCLTTLTKALKYDQA